TPRRTRGARPRRRPSPPPCCCSVAERQRRDGRSRIAGSWRWHGAGTGPSLGSAAPTRSSPPAPGSALSSPDGSATGLPDETLELPDGGGVREGPRSGLRGGDVEDGHLGRALLRDRDVGREVALRHGEGG